jgi:hypothetical protein
MEYSPIRFLDNDVSQILADHVRLSQEEEARKFHLYIYVAPYELPFGIRVSKVTIHRVFKGLGRFWGDFWDEELSGKIKMSILPEGNSSYGTSRWLAKTLQMSVWIRPRPSGCGLSAAAGVRKRIILYEKELINIMNGRNTCSLRHEVVVQSATRSTSSVRAAPRPGATATRAP